MKSIIFFLAATSGISQAWAELPREFQYTTYADCVSPEDYITRVRVSGEYSHNSAGEVENITVISDSKLITSDDVLTHQFSSNEEIYEGPELTLTLKKNSEGSINAKLVSRSVPLPTEIFLCRQLR